MWVLSEQVSERTRFRVDVVSGDACTWGADVRCRVPARLMVPAVIIGLGMLAYCIMFYVYIFRAFRQYKKELYHRCRLGNLLVRMQARSHLATCVRFGYTPRDTRGTGCMCTKSSNQQGIL